jgi:hypothetical protein
MASIPTNAPTTDQAGLIGGDNITINKTVSAVNKNEPIFGVGSEALVGYVALEMYEQHQASVVGGNGGGGSGYSLFDGESYASGKPYVIAESVWATGEGI